MTGKVVVAKIGGSILQDEHLLDKFIGDVQLLVKDGVSIAIVHGGGPAINKKLASLKKEPVKVQGLRVTDSDTLSIVVEVLSSINNQIVEKLLGSGVKALGFNPANGVLFAAEKLLLNSSDGSSIDLGFVGKIIGTDKNKLTNALLPGSVAVIAPLGVGADAAIYNINADTAADAVAAALSADSLVNVTDVPGLLQDPLNAQSIIKHLTAAQAKELIDKGAVGGGMLPKLQSCVAALASGVKTVQIIGGHAEHGFLQAVTKPGSIGSLISAGASSTISLLAVFEKNETKSTVVGRKWNSLDVF